MKDEIKITPVELSDEEASGAAGGATVCNGSYTCPHCGRTYTYVTEHIRKIPKCPNCGYNPETGRV